MASFHDNGDSNTTNPDLPQASPERSHVEMTYDAQDNLRTVTDPRGLVTTYTYNGFNELTQLESPDTQQTDYTYDPASRGYIALW